MWPFAFVSPPRVFPRLIGEVPFDRLGAENPGLLRFQMLVERVCVRAVEVDLSEHRKGDTEFAGAD